MKLQRAPAHCKLLTATWILVLTIVTLETLALKPQFQKINVSREIELADL